MSEVELIARDLCVEDLVIANNPNRTLAYLGHSIVLKLSTVQILCKENALDYLDSEATTRSPGGKVIC